jgi:copper oxidase (laccase) domain-containing protein
MVAAIGPSIGPCCYEVGRTCTRPSPAPGYAPGTLRHVAGSDRAYLDLWQANALQLAAAGVGRIEMAGICTPLPPG